MSDRQLLVELANYFEEPLALPHRWNARKKHLGGPSFEGVGIDALLDYIRYLVHKKGGVESMESQAPKTNSKIKNLEVRQYA